MKKFSVRCLLALLFSAALVAGTNAQTQFEKSAKWVPESANCIVMVQSEKIYSSKLAEVENWGKSRSAAFRSGASFFPPSTRRILIASQIDYEFMDSSWHVGVFEIGGPALNIVDISKRITGNIDSIGDKKALLLPNHSYLIQIDDSTLVTMTPGNRQHTTRWLNSKLTGQMSVSPYLEQAVKFADNNADVIIALDLDGVINEQEIVKRLKESGAVSDVSVEQHAKTLASISGLTLGVTVNDKISGSIKIDFKESPASLSKVAKDILIAALKKNGMMIDDITTWTVATGPKQIRLSGPLSSEGLRQVGSLVHQPLMDDFTGGGSSSSGEPIEADMATKTLQYWGDVQHVVAMIRRKDVSQLDTYTKWFNRYARELDGISVLGVDPVMVSYGTYVANTFRDVSGGLEDSDLSRAKNVASQGFSGPGGRSFNYGYGYGTISGRNYTRDSRRSAGSISTMAGKDNAMKVLRELSSKSAEVSRAMTEKYQKNFPVSDSKLSGGR